MATESREALQEVGEEAGEVGLRAFGGIVALPLVLLESRALEQPVSQQLGSTSVAQAENMPWRSSSLFEFSLSFVLS